VIKTLDLCFFQLAQNIILVTLTLLQLPMPTNVRANV